MQSADRAHSTLLIPGVNPLREVFSKMKGVELFFNAGSIGIPPFFVLIDSSGEHRFTQRNMPKHTSFCC